MTNILSHLFSQKKNSSARLTTHRSIEPLEKMLMPTHCVTETFHIAKVKSDCRIQWYLTLTQTAHASQICSSRLCKICPHPTHMTVDLSDEKLDRQVDGDVCLILKKIPKTM